MVLVLQVYAYAASIEEIGVKILFARKGTATMAFDTAFSRFCQRRVTGFSRFFPTASAGRENFGGIFRLRQP
jgi:hypothetical protein